MARHAVLLLACTAWSTLAEKCDDFRCPSGSEPRQGEEGRTPEECCHRQCSSFSCPSHSGFVSINNVSAAGLTTASCCRKLPSCTANSRYVPLSSPSLDAGRAKVAASSIECAERCQATTGCIGFTWLSDSSCHLAGANATLRFMPGGVSGNTTCHSLRPHLQRKEDIKVHEFCQRQPGRCTGKVHQLFAQASPQILSSGSSSSAQLDLAGVAVVDWDADGRLDVVTSHGSGRLGLFLQGSDGKFSASTDNPFRSIEVGESAKPTVFDWDGDGELDVLVGNADGDLKFLKGSGDGAVAMTWNWYPFSTLTTLGRTAPAIADFTDDEHPDLVLGHGCQLDVYLGQGNHSLALAASHDFASSGSSGSCAIVPTVWDWDGDGMKEVIVGDQAGKFNLCRLINGTTLICEALEGYGVGEMASPSACDWDSDGVPDLIVQSGGLQDLAWFRRGPRPDVLEVPAADPALFGFDVGESAVPVLVDWDLDGDLDLIVGSADGRLWFFPQENGEFVSSNQRDGPFASVDVGSHCAPAAVDWDSDGFPDLILGSGQGRLTLLRGGSAGPLLEGQQLFASVDLKMPVQPAVVDWDSDGDLDLLLLAGGRIHYFRNEHGRFVQVADEYNPFSQVGDVLRRQGLSTHDSLCLQAIDADSDGDLDLVVGGLLLEQLSDGTLKYLTGSDSAFPSQWPGPSDGPPCLAYGDLDMDGVLDLVVGFRDGRLDLGLGKVGEDFKAQEGLANPVGDLGLGMARKTPGVVDWNGDGKADLLVSADGMRLFLREADGSLKETATKLPSLEGCSPLSIVTVDWTMDGDDDVLLIEKQALVLLERNGSEGFLPAFEVFHWSLRDGLHTVTGGTVADWDEDGLFDILVGLESGRLQHWRQRASGQMQLVPEDESPFAGIVGEGSAQPAMADVNGDGKLDLILGSSGRLQIYLQDEGGKLNRRHVLDGWRGDVVPVAADWNGDGDSEIILGTSSNDLVYLDQGPCAPRDACLGQSGLCNSKSQVCDCLPGHSGIDCSKCATGFSSTPRNSERGHDCYPCPGNSDACSHRGVCVDDHYVQAAAVGRREISDPRLLRGNGSCICHPNYFGKDCAQGECPAGQEPAADLASGSIRCRTCQQGFGKEQSGNHECAACQPGTAAFAGDGSCLPCGAGEYQPRVGQSECILCSSGSETDEGRTACSPCPSGTVGVLGTCQLCPSFTTAGSSRTQCVMDWVLLMAALLFTLLTLVFFQLVVYIPGARRNIADITWSAVDEAVIVTMQSRHHFGSRLLKVRLYDTGIPFLDPCQKTPYFFVRALSPTHLQLYTEPKIALTTPVEASSGTLKPLLMSEALGTRFFGIPVLFWLGMAALAIIILASLAPIPWWYLLLTAGLALASVLSLRLRAARLDALTPLQRLLRQYALHLRAATSPASCEPGGLRAVSIARILHFHEFFRSLIQHRNMHYVCTSIIKPVTKKSQLSFAELAGPGTVDWFISHFWALPFQDFAQSLRAHAMYVGRDWEAIKYWICSFSQNQWRLEEELCPGTLRESSFHKALMAPSCQGTGMMMDSELTPLKRSWCLFEMLQTFNLHERGLSQHRLAPFMGLFLLHPAGVLNVGRGSVDMAVRIGKQLDNLRLEDASATEVADKQRIDDEVRSAPGGFAAFNCKLRAELRLVLEQMSSRFSDDLSELNSQLYEGDSQEVEIHLATDPAPEHENKYCSWTG